MAKILSKEMFKMAIAINKNILQAFYTIYNQQKIEDYVYLENEQEFQIYLKNYREIPVIVELIINGKSEKEAIVLEPKEKLFLERYISNNFKFKFNIYKLPINLKNFIENKVELATITAKVYTAQNIYVKKNTTIIRPILTLQTLDYPDNYVYTYNSNSAPNIFVINYCIQKKSKLLFNNYCILELLQPTSICNEEILNFIEYSDQKLSKENFQNTKEEIGIIEKGEYSNQKFEKCSNFKRGKLLNQYIIYLYSTNDQIHKENNVIYCSTCGRKQKYGQKYCPADGTKFGE